MRMLGERWICDSEPTECFPQYAPGNADEVLAESVRPLGWTSCCEPAMVRSSVDDFWQLEVFDALEHDEEWPDSLALFGGYLYNSLTSPRHVDKLQAAVAERTND